MTLPVFKTIFYRKYIKSFEEAFMRRILKALLSPKYYI